MRKSTFVVAVGAFAAFGLGASQASATTFVAEGFGYADGQLTGTTPASNAPVDVSGGTWVGHSGTTFSDNIDVLAGSAILNNPGSEDANRILSHAVGAAETIYYAAKFTVTGPPVTGNVNDDYFIHLKDNGFGFVGRASIRDSVSGDYELGIQSGSSFPLSGASSGVGLTFGTENLVVVKWDNATGTATAWVNPSSEADPSFGGIADASRIATPVNRIALRQDFFTTPGVDSNVIAVNGLAAASSFAEAVAGSMVVPEPASLALLGLGGVAMLRRR